MPSHDAFHMVTIDGRPYQRGLTWAQAEAVCKQMQEGYEGHRSSDKRRIGCFEIKIDKQAVERDNRLFRAS